VKDLVEEREKREAFVITGVPEKVEGERENLNGLRGFHSSIH
jgi:hypothetical protein